MSFLELFKLEKDKQRIVFVFSNAKRGGNVKEGEVLTVELQIVFLEREHLTSL